MDLIFTILPVVTKDLPISPRFTPYNFLSRCKFSTLTTRQPMVEFYLLTFPRFPLRKKEHKSYFGKNRTHDFRTSRCADYLLDHSASPLYFFNQSYRTEYASMTTCLIFSFQSPIRYFLLGCRRSPGIRNPPSFSFQECRISSPIRYGLSQEFTFFFANRNSSKSIQLLIKKHTVYTAPLTYAGVDEFW